MALSDALMVLDCLEAGSCSLSNLTQWVFAADQTRALNTLRHMLRDGTILITIGGRPVEAWAVDTWLRTLDAPQTQQTLTGVLVTITDDGVRYFSG